MWIRWICFEAKRGVGFQPANPYRINLAAEVYMSRYAKAMLNHYDGIGHRVGDFLSPGISATRQRKALKDFRRRLPRWFCQTMTWFRDEFPTSLPATLTALYVWRNGIGHTRGAKLGNLHFVPGYYLVPLKEALDSWKIVTEAVHYSESYENDNTVFLGACPFPFMADDTGDHVVMDIRKGSPTYGSIGRFDRTGYSSRRAEYATLSKCLQAHYECCKEGAYRLDKDGYLEKDYKKSECILARYQN